MEGPVMSLLPFRKEPLSLNELQDQMNMLFSRLWHTGVSMGPFDGQDWAPPVDVFEDADRYVVTAELPGLNVDDIEVTYTGNSLTLAGQKVSDVDEESKKGFLCRERRFGRFSRTVTLPDTVDGGKVSAACRNGLLEVVLPKKQESKPVSVKIEVEQEGS
jgi:HSP20 family protein